MSQETLEEIREQADIRLGTGKGRSGAGFRTRKEQGSGRSFALWRGRASWD